MQFVRLKCSVDPNQVNDRIKYHPEILELQINENDFVNPENLHLTIAKLKQLGIKIYLHHPCTYKNKKLDILSSDREMTSYYQWSCACLSDLCKQENVYCVLHAHYSKSESSFLKGRSATLKMRARIEKTIQTYGDCFLWENTTSGLFSFANPYLFSEIIQPLHLPMCFDVSHAFISLGGSNKQLHHLVNLVDTYVHYVHVVDSAGTHHDALPLGKGKIDWRSLKPFLIKKDFIFEIGLKDWLDCKPMIESVNYFLSIS
ncbi:sugar phosphate isomerase/epimerase [Sporolactobacillus kofuensis]|uniref:Sugar phosphate isomerase/epimerase n=1 Tax=Sporolactobacillus kofuensis TaxID=269672 RepID=A0ABW1WEL7_9BACL|nr:sugar phosphate isomerase/epimerase [Sporolactobacillus kofuensis]MCO7175208.1 sugar phosphate isomerase/epimerase [Sporolactobacillus kofuensis]